jgi:hypothetical protein
MAEQYRIDLIIETEDPFTLSVMKEILEDFIIAKKGWKILKLKVI